MKKGQTYSYKIIYSIIHHNYILISTKLEITRVTLPR